MKTKCSQCCTPIDTENDEYLMTTSGPICIDCANGGVGQSDNSESSEVHQTYL